MVALVLKKTAAFQRFGITKNATAHVLLIGLVHQTLRWIKKLADVNAEQGNIVILHFNGTINYAIVRVLRKIACFQRYGISRSVTARVLLIGVVQIIL